MPAMNAAEFIEKWRNAKLKERSSAQEHFIDLCRLLGEKTPAEADPDGTWFAFEAGATKAGGGNGWADVWKRGCFAWEYKSKGKDLQAAFRQLQQYAPALDYPPLLIVSDINTIVIHTAFTGTVHETYVITLDDLLDAKKRQLLKWAFTAPERLKPGTTTAEVTQQAAKQFAELAQSLRQRGHDAHDVAHFLNQILFCFFAEDVGLLPEGLFTRLLENAADRPERFPSQVRALFGAMAEGGDFGVEIIDWFNGGLFAGETAVFELTTEELRTLASLGHQDWSAIEPSIIGTLFERGLDPAKRSQLGAHYTDPESIMRLVRPTILEPLEDEWTAVKREIEKAQARTKKGHSKKAEQLYQAFLERLRNFRVLDPACGSGNFLYLALKTLKDFEHRVILEAEALGMARQFPAVGPECVHGIEINTYAAELARVTVWIGDIQWMLANGYNVNRHPVLRPLETIEQRDAIINPDDTEPEWPEADVIIGNPPFLGDKKMIAELGEEYVTRLRTLYKGRVPGGADLVTYWFEKARAQIEQGRARYAGLVATNSIRGGKNRKVLERICKTGAIFHAWSDEPWINEGAAVRVSLVCFGLKDHGRPVCLDGKPVEEIYPDLTGGAGRVDVTKAKQLEANKGIAFQGIKRVGEFDIPGEMARQWLALPNPHGRPNSDVLRPWVNAMDITRRPRDMWIIDFGCDMSEEQAALYEKPFEYVCEHVRPKRVGKREEKANTTWWRFQRCRPEMRAALASLQRFIATPLVSKHRIFVWQHKNVIPDGALSAIARDDDVSFGILHSRFHEVWALAMGTSLGVGNDPRYTPTSTFETFPFPDGLTPDRPAEHYANPHAEAIAEAARELVRLRDNWLNPPDWVEVVPEAVEHYPLRIIPRPEHAAALKKRTLTNLYNQRPAWLENAHQMLDRAVAAAYGWDDYTPEMTDNEILRRLLELNQIRAQTE